MTAAIANMMAQTFAKRDRKKQRKIQKKFALSLLNGASGCGWEDHETAKLVGLIAESMEFSDKKLLRFLSKTSIMSSEMIACVIDNGTKIKPLTIISFLRKSVNSMDEFIAEFAQSFDHDILSADDPEVIVAVRILLLICKSYDKV
jgi:hypothetical protein